MEFGLNQRVIHKIQDVFKMYPDIDQVVLYGSRAKGTYKNGSDIDLCLFGEHIDLTLLNRIANELDELDLPYTFDLSVYKYLTNSSLISHIDRRGLIFFKKR